MNAKQSNKLGMFKEVLAFLLSLTATSLPKALAAKVALLKTLVARIGELNNTQTTPNGTALDLRAKAGKAAIDLTFVVAGAVLSFARTSGRADVAPLVDITRSDFERARRGERMRLARRVLDAAQPIVAELADYGVTAETLTTLESIIGEGDKAADGARTLSADKKAATGALAKAFKAVAALLDEIDPLLESLRQSDPDAYARYQIAREVIDRPGGRTASGDQSPAANPPAADQALPHAA